MKKIVLLILCIALIAAMFGCSKSSAKENVDVRGEITELVLGNDNKPVRIMVEGDLEEDVPYDKASVSIDKKTKVYMKDDGKKLEAADLKKGMKVEAIFEGPVAESYPIQAKAREIRVLEDTPEE
jgi:beta-N-acetylhexosaminidase